MKKLGVVRVITQTSEKILDGAHSEKKDETALRSAHARARGLVRATSPLKSCTKGLVAQFTESDLRSKSQGLVPKVQTGLNLWHKLQGLVPGLRLDFETKIASSRGGTLPRDLLQGLVAGTNTLGCSNLVFNTQYF